MAAGRLRLLRRRGGCCCCSCCCWRRLSSPRPPLSGRCSAGSHSPVPSPPRSRRRRRRRTDLRGSCRRSQRPGGAGGGGGRGQRLARPGGRQGAGPAASPLAPPWRSLPRRRRGLRLRVERRDAARPARSPSRRVLASGGAGGPPSGTPGEGGKLWAGWAGERCAGSARAAPQARGTAPAAPPRWWRRAFLLGSPRLCGVEGAAGLARLPARLTALPGPRWPSG